MKQVVWTYKWFKFMLLCLEIWCFLFQKCIIKKCTFQKVNWAETCLPPRSYLPTSSSELSRVCLDSSCTAYLCPRNADTFASWPVKRQTHVCTDTTTPYDSVPTMQFKFRVGKMQTDKQFYFFCQNGNFWLGRNWLGPYLFTVKLTQLLHLHGQTPSVLVEGGLPLDGTFPKTKV